MSYGPDSDNNGIITSYQYGRGTNQIPNERFLIFDDVSEDDIGRFYSNYYEKYATVTDEEGPVYGSSIDRVIYEGSKTYRKKKSSKKPLSYCGNNAFLILLGMQKSFKNSTCLIRKGQKGDLNTLYKWFHKTPRKLGLKHRVGIIRVCF